MSTISNIDDTHMTVVMYSKFSQACTSFLELLKKVPTFKQTLLCIDNEDVRKRVNSHPKLNITEVPCIFRIYEKTGYVESFEGDRAFTILNTHYNYYLEKLERDQILRAQPLETPQPPVQTHSPLQPPRLQSTNLTNLTNDIFDIASQPPSQTTMASTPIEQLGSNSLDTYMHIQPLSSSGSNLTNTPSVDRAVKSGSGGNIVTRAMQMQKERESDAPAKGPHPV